MNEEDRGAIPNITSIAWSIRFLEGNSLSNFLNITSGININVDVIPLT